MKLKEIRRTKGLSQSQLAKKAGLNIRTLQYYEQGVKSFDRARLTTILKCAIALDCRIDEIIEDKDCLILLEKYKEARTFETDVTTYSDF